ncbi:MAG: Permease, partial [Parcubacteria group bacterium GW2011_GWA2_51_10]
FTKRYLEFIDPITFTAYTFLAAGFVFLIVTLVRGHGITFRFREGFLLGILIFFLEVPQTIGLSQTTAANTAFITAIGMLFIPFLTYLLYRHPIHPSTWLALATAFVGIELLTGGIVSFNSGDLWVTLAAVGCLFYIVFTEHFEKEKKAILYPSARSNFSLSVLFHSSSRGGRARVSDSTEKEHHGCRLFG